jgi:Flp pilus assembly protein TadB
MTLILNVISPTYFDEFYAWQGGLGRMIAFALYGFIVLGIFVIGKMSDLDS